MFYREIESSPENGPLCYPALIESIRQASWGLRQIERAIIAGVRARGVPITTADFSWNRGQSLLSDLPPNLIPMDLQAGSRRVSTQWPRTHLEDSWDRIDRWEVRQEIERIVEALASQP